MRWALPSGLAPSRQSDGWQTVESAKKEVRRVMAERSGSGRLLMSHGATSVQVSVSRPCPLRGSTLWMRYLLCQRSDR